MKAQKITIFTLSYLLLIACNFIYAQEKVDAKEQARQHYQQGKQFYSEGRYQEATSEFEKAVALIDPGRLQFLEGVQEEQQRVLVTSPAQEVKLVEQKLAAKKEEERVKEKAKEKKAEETIITKPEEAQPEKEYYIDIGDVLDISVWQIADLSRSEVIVRPDGKISFPLIGDIIVERRTLTELDSIITEKLKAYVKAPEVSIMIRRFGEQANKVVLLGEVLGPGIYKFSSPPTITEAVAAAGGYTKYAVLNSIMVIRGDLRVKPEAIRVNVAEVLKSARLSENIFLRPNDIVYVPRSFIGKFNTFLEVFQPAINQYLQTLNARHLHNTVHRKGGV